MGNTFPKNIIENIYNINYLQNEYKEYFQIVLENQDYNYFLQNEVLPYFLLIFPETREFLYKSKYKNLLSHTKEGCELLLKYKEIKILLQSNDGCKIIFDSEFKNHIHDSQLAITWASEYSDESRKLLLENTEFKNKKLDPKNRRKMLENDLGCKFILLSEFKNELVNNEFSINWAFEYNDESRFILFNNPKTKHVLLKNEIGIKFIINHNLSNNFLDSKNYLDNEGLIFYLIKKIFNFELFDSYQNNDFKLFPNLGYLNNTKIDNKYLKNNLFLDLIKYPEFRKYLLLISTGCYLILTFDNGIYKNELCNTLFSSYWCLYYNDKTRKILLNDESKRHLLLKTEEGCYIILNSIYKNELVNDNFSQKWAYFYSDKSKNILLANEQKKKYYNDKFEKDYETQIYFLVYHKKSMQLQ